MNALLQHELGPFTIDDWHALPARSDGSRLELLEGHWLVTPPPSGQHQVGEKRIIKLLDAAIENAQRTDLTALGGIGIEISTSGRTAIIPDFAVLNAAPVGTSFSPQQIELVGEIWSPGNSWLEQRQKLEAGARTGIPFFWSIAQDGRGPSELVAYRLVDGHYTPEITADLDTGPVSVTASPVPVELGVAGLRV